MRKLLFITSIKGMWPFVENLCNNLIEKDYLIDVLDHEQNCLIQYNSGEKLKKIKFVEFFKKFAHWKFYYLWKSFTLKKYKSFLLKLTDNYDITLVLYHDSKFNKIAKEIEKTSKKLVLAYAGSDFFNATDKIKNDNIKLINLSDNIVFGNPYMAKRFLDYYNDFHQKVFIASMGLHNLDLIKKIKEKENIEQSKEILDIPKDKIIISIGYTGDKRHRQLDFVEMIGNNFSEQIKEKIFLLIPMTYINTKEYINEIENIANQLNISHKIFDKILTDSDICRLRICTDVAVHIATMDQSSASMLEHIFAENVVIAGKWLPYQFWDDMGLVTYRLEENKIIEKLLFVLENLKQEKLKLKDNSRIIYENYSWEKKIQNWLEVL